MKDEENPLTKKLLSDDYHKKAISIIRWHGVNQNDADDLYQNLCVNVITSSGEYDSSRSPDAYLNKAIKNLVIDKFRADGRKKRACVKNESDFPDYDYTLLDISESTSDGPSANVERIEMRDVVMNTLGALPDRHSAILKQRYFARMSYASIAEVSGIPMGTVKSRLNEAKRIFGKHAKKGNLELQVNA